ncbi:CRISPR-associated endonuclease Cas1 [Lachnospiraceae bacterium]|nr:CRISPR-associated endonuclease Cas1 [Lachnospiraceae bacterium]
MSYLYVAEQGATIGITDNRFQVKYKDGMLKSIPAETLEVIEIFGKVQITTQCLEECLKRGVNIIFYSTYGAYYGRLISTAHVNVQRQRIQAEIWKDDQFKLIFSKRIIDAKIRNQIVILRRYARSKGADIDRPVIEMQNAIEKIKNSAVTIGQVMGYEGIAAKVYFEVLGKLIDSDFTFKGRTKRPPLDPFNSLISLGYSIMLNEIYGKLEAKGLNPYFGIMHKDREKHPTLASDLMEEWRAVLIDSTALSMLNGHELEKEDFYTNVEQPGVFLAKDGFKSYIKKLESKFRTENKYLSYVDYQVSFRKAMDLQVNQFVKAIEAGDPTVYMPIVIR